MDTGRAADWAAGPRTVSRRVAIYMSGGPTTPTSKHCNPCGLSFLACRKSLIRLSYQRFPRTKGSGQ